MNAYKLIKFHSAIIVIEADTATLGTVWYIKYRNKMHRYQIERETVKSVKFSNFKRNDVRIMYSVNYSFQVFRYAAPASAPRTVTKSNDIMHILYSICCVPSTHDLAFDSVSTAENR